MSVKEMLNAYNNTGIVGSAKSTFEELIKPETFKRTMRSLVDFRGSKVISTAEQIPQINVKTAPTQSELKYAELVNAESAYGRTLFGPIPQEHQREFFEHKKNVWVWHDSWLDENGSTQGITIRYEVRPVGVYKKYAGGTYTRIEGEELDNFRHAARMYLDLVKSNIYTD